MSFVVAMDGRLDEAVRRAAHVELTRAIANLTLPESMLHEGVHEARKSFKRLRALYRLLAAADPAAAAVEIARFRDAAAALAAARDAAAMVEAFERLCLTFPDDVADGALSPVETWLLRRRDRATGAGSDASAAIRAAIAACRAAYGAIDAYPLPQSQKAMRDLLADGFAASVRKVRRALAGARSEASPEALHRLRKRVKDHLYHLGLLRQLWPPADGRDRRAAVDELGERLGDLNDCDVLAGILRTEPPGLRAEPAAWLALQLLSRQQKALSAFALRRTARLFAESPRRMGHAARRRLKAPATH